MKLPDSLHNKIAESDWRPMNEAPTDTGSIIYVRKLVGPPKTGVMTYHSARREGLHFRDLDSGTVVMFPNEWVRHP